MRKVCEALVIMIGTCGWWGFVYPDLCLTDDVYEQAYTEGEGMGQREPVAKREQAAPKGAEPEAAGERQEGIRIKSRLWEYLCGEAKK